MLHNDTGVPKFLQLKREIACQIHEGVFPPGARLPTVRDWMAKYHVSLSTVRQALAELARDGLVVCTRGAGTFVTSLRPSPASRNGRGLSAGVLFPDLSREARYSNQGLYAILRGAESVLRQRGGSLAVAFYAPTPEGEKTAMRAAAEQGAAGLIVYPSYTSPLNDYYRALEAAGLPVVLVDSLVEGVEADCVRTANADSARDGVRLLLSAGATRVAFISGYFRAATSRERLAGARQALALAGLALRESDILEGDFTPEFGRKAMGLLLDRKDGADGVLIANEMLTLGAMEALRDRAALDGRSARICSFYEPNPFLESFAPAILLRQPREKTGETAAAMLLERIAERETGRPRVPPRRVLLPADVILPPWFNKPSVPGPVSRPAEDRATRARRCRSRQR